MTQKMMKWFEDTTLGQVCAVFIAAAIFWVVIIPIYWLAGGSMDWFQNLFHKIHLDFLVDWYRNVTGS